MEKTIHADHGEVVSRMEPVLKAGGPRWAAAGLAAFGLWAGLGELDSVVDEASMRRRARQGMEEHADPGFGFVSSQPLRWIPIGCQLHESEPLIYRNALNLLVLARRIERPTY